LSQTGKEAEVSNPFEREKKKRDFRKANRTFKRNRDSRPPRKKRWFVEDFEDGDVYHSERVMPRDEHERRRKVARMALQE
jgi:hypothetical protein